MVTFSDNHMSVIMPNYYKANSVSGQDEPILTLRLATRVEKNFSEGVAGATKFPFVICAIKNIFHGS